MDINQLKQSCEKTLAHLEQSFMRLQMWRASTGLVEEMHVHINARGMDQKMNQVASISTMDAQTLRIEPRDKSILKDIEKAIYDANVWLTPLNQWDYIMIKVPPLTQERRTEITKVVSRDAEDAKVAIRNHRHDARKHVENQFKNDELSENEKGSLEKQIDEVAKKYTDEIEQLAKTKSEEVMKL